MGVGIKVFLYLAFLTKGTIYCLPNGSMWNYLYRGWEKSVTITPTV